MSTPRPPSDRQLTAAARRLGRTLTRRRLRSATAESCTGGLVGHAITAVPKASDHYLGGVISYSNLVKERDLGLSAELLRAGAVSAEAAEAMAEGVLGRFPEAQLGIAVTGIAGPDGASAEKPVGLTYVAAALRGGPAAVERHLWEFDRDGNKRASALAALELAHRLVSEA